MSSPIWTPETAAAFAASPEAAESIHNEATTPDHAAGETRVFFSRRHGVFDGSCPWCILGNCWQRVTELGPADGLAVVHGRRVV